MGWILGAGLIFYLWYQSQSGTGAASSISTGTPSPATPSTSAAPLLPGDAIYFGPVGSGQTFTFGSQSFAVPGYVYYAPSTGQFYETTTPPTNDQASAGTSYTWPTAPPQCVHSAPAMNANGQMVSAQVCSQGNPPAISDPTSIQAPPSVSMSGLGYSIPHKGGWAA